MKLHALYRFPVKGLSGERMPRVALRTGHGFPLDRVYAVTDGSLDFDEAAPKPAPKTQFLMLAKHERLARLRTRFEEAGKLLTVEEDGAPTRAFALETPGGCASFAAYLGAQAGLPLPGTPRVVRAEGHQFTDVSVHGVELMRSISLINLATVRELGERVGAVLDPIRFRGNLLFDGAAPWSELDWVGRRLVVGDVHLRVVRRTRRCAATSVNPATAVRDINVPLQIREHRGHGDLGIYAEVLDDGTITEGDAMRLLDDGRDAADPASP